MDGNTSVISTFGKYTINSFSIDSGTDLNTLLYSGIYMGNGLVNAPKGSNEWFHIEVIRHNDIYTVQKAYPFTNGTCPVYIRTQTNGTWNGWRLFNPGTANTAQVLSGYTFSSANGVNLSGGMTNRGGLTYAQSVDSKYDSFVVRIPKGAYLTNGTYNTTYPEIMVPFNLFTQSDKGLDFDSYAYYNANISSFPFETKYLTATHTGRFIAVFGGSMGYSNTQVGGYGRIYSPSMGKLLGLQLVTGGCAVSNGGGFIAISSVVNLTKGTTICGRIDNSYSNSNAGNGYANIIIALIRL